jgi:hypothetical protein
LAPRNTPRPCFQTPTTLITAAFALAYTRNAVSCTNKSVHARLLHINLFTSHTHLYHLQPAFSNRLARSTHDSLPPPTTTTTNGGVVKPFNAMMANPLMSQMMMNQMQQSGFHAPQFMQMPMQQSNDGGGGGGGARGRRQHVVRHSLEAGVSRRDRHGPRKQGGTDREARVRSFQLSGRCVPLSCTLLSFSVFVRAMPHLCANARGVR